MLKGAGSRASSITAATGEPPCKQCEVDGCKVERRKDHVVEHYHNKVVWTESLEPASEEIAAFQEASNDAKQHKRHFICNGYTMDNLPTMRYQPAEAKESTLLKMIKMPANEADVIVMTLHHLLVSLLIVMTQMTLHHQSVSLFILPILLPVVRVAAGPLKHPQLTH